MGVGNFITYSKLYCNTIVTRVAHNSFLHIAAEMGLIGLVLFVSIFIITFKNLKRCWRCLKGSKYYYFPIGIMFGILGFMVHSLFLSEQYNVSLFIMIALTVVIDNLISFSKSENDCIANLSKNGL